jgi:hypothetical protein
MAGGSGTRAAQSLDVRVLAGRFEGCPIEVRAGPLAMRPCVAFELGDLSTEGEGMTGRSDSALWAASELGARLRWPAEQVFSLEAQLGLIVPFARYELIGGEAAHVVHHTVALAAAARIAARVHFP